MINYLTIQRRYLNSIGPSDAYMRKSTVQSLFGAKSSPEHHGGKYQLKPLRQPSVKFKTKW